MRPDSSRVAVIVPMHNSERHLEQAVESIVAQSFGDWHAVLVDDASQDGTRALAAALTARDPDRFTLVDLKQNVGVAEARNRGIEAAPETELIALLDHDDYWLAAYLERVVATYDAAVGAGHKVGIVASDALIHEPEGLTRRSYSDRVGRSETIDLDLMLERNAICARATFTRRAYREVGGFSPACPGYDDYDLWLRIIEAGYSVELIDEPLAVYREHPEAMSHDQELMAAGAIETYSRALGRGGLTARQRARARSRVRHYRALREREIVRRGLRERDYRLAARHAIRAVAAGLTAFAQAPGRWGEWLLRRRVRRARTSS